MRRWIRVAFFASMVVGCGPMPVPAALAPVAPRPLVRSLDATTTQPKAVNFAQVQDPAHAELKLYRGGQPTDEDWQILAKMGVTVDINLLDGTGKDAAVVSHEKALVTQLRIKWVNLPVPYGVELPQAMAQQFLDVVAKSGADGVYVHCKTGKDRTGEMVAAYRIKVDGYTSEQALTEMEHFHYQRAQFPWITSFVMKLGASR